MEKKQILSEEKIIKQDRRLNRLSLAFSINVFLAAVGIFALIILIKQEFDGFKISKTVDFLKELNFLRLGILLAVLLAAIADIAVSAYFIKYFPKKRRDKTANNIKSTGKRDKGEIIKTEIHRKSIYETVYKVVLKSEDSGKEVFCFYTVDKSEPSPLGEKWRFYYDENSGFAVLTKRISYKIL